MSGKPGFSEVRCIFFDVDDVLYDSTKLAEAARRNAIIAMKEAGLPVEDMDEAYEKLMEIVGKYGANYPYHFDRLLGALGMERDPHIIAAGVAAYHDTKFAYLKPFPETIPTILKLKEKGYKIGIISDGRAVKQWEKLIRLGIQHFFEIVITSEEAEVGKPDPEIFRLALKKVGCEAPKAMMVGDRLDRDVLGAKKTGMIAVWIKRGKYASQKPESPEAKPEHEIENLSEILELLDV